MTDLDIDGMAHDFLRSLDGYDCSPASIAFEFARLRLVALLDDAWDDGYIVGRKGLPVLLLVHRPANQNEAEYAQNCQPVA